MRKLRIWLAVLAAVLLSLALIRQGIALAECRLTSSSGDDDIVICNNAPTRDGIDTAGGNDTVTVEAGVEIATPYNAIFTASGADTVTNYGLIRSGQDPVDLGSGRDVMRNYGTLDGRDDGVGCAPVAGEVCEIYNYGSITAAFEAVDYRSDGGGGYIYNEGTITSAEEALHLRLGVSYQVVNKGTIRAGSSGIEVYGAPLTIMNYGVIETAGRREASHTFVEYAVNFDSFDDSLNNTGTITNSSGTAIGLGKGNDVVENSGTITATSSNPQMAAILGEDGNDRIVNSGSISELGSGYAAIGAGHGSDTVIIRGGLIRGLISGDNATGNRSGDTDTLIFQLTGSQAEINAFRQQVEGQSGSSGQATWQGNTYKWAGFESIQLDLVVGGSE